MAQVTPGVAARFPQAASRERWLGDAAKWIAASSQNLNDWDASRFFVATDTAYGADSAGVDDSTQAIQGAINAAAAAGGGVVFLPRGTYLISSPLNVTTSNVLVLGEGPGITKMRYAGGGGTGSLGPFFIFDQPRTLPLVASTTNAGQLAWQITAGAAINPWICFSDNQQAVSSFNGQSRFDLRILWRSPSSFADGVLFSAMSRQLTSDAARTGLCEIFVDAGGNVTGRLNMGGTFVAVGSGSPLSTSTLYHVRLSLSGGTLRLFINGAVSGSAAAAGTVQCPAHTEIFPAHNAQYTMESGEEFAPVAGTYESFIMGLNSVSGAFTAPTVKEQRANSDDIFGLDFNTSGTGWLGVATAQGTHKMAVRWPTFGTPIRHSGLSGFEFFGTGGVESNGVVFQTAQDSKISKLLFTNTMDGLFIRNNSFNSQAVDIEANLTSNGRYGVANIHASGVNQFRDIKTSGGLYGFISDNSSISFENLYTQISRVAGASFLERGGGAFTTIVGKFLVSTDENGTAAPTLGHVVLDSLKELQISGGVIDASHFAGAQVWQVAGTAVQGSILGVHQAVHASTTRVINFTQTPTKRLDLRAFGGYGSVSLTNQAGGISRWEDGMNTGTVGISATGTQAKNLAGQATVADAATTAVWTFPVNEPDTNYHVAVVPVAKTGAPAAGSLTVDTVTKAVGSVTLNLAAAPGAGTSRTFDIHLLRGA